MGSYADIINKRKRDWNCSSLMDSAHAERGEKLPFSSPLLNYSTYGGIPRGQITEFFGNPGGGKAQPMYSKVLKTTGWTTMRDIQIGDSVLTHTGQVGEVIGIFPQGKRPVYRIHLSDYTHIDVADNHLNLIEGGKVVTTDWLIYQYQNQDSNQDSRINIPVANLARWKFLLTLMNEEDSEKLIVPHERYIVNIQYLGLMECQCIYIDHEDHTYISDYFIPTHNTTTSIDICKNATKIFHEEYDKHVSLLRERSSKGDKVAHSELVELEERGPKKVLYLDLEHSFDDSWAKKLGVDNEDIDIMQPPDVVAEDLLQTVQELIETSEVGLVVLDSIPSLVTKQELEKKYGERTVSALAGLLTIFFRKIVPILKRYDCTLLIINQERDNMDNPYVAQTPGGRALKFYCSLRIQFRIGSPVDFLGNELPSNAENPAGHIVTAKIVKQKSAPWDRKNASYYLMAQTGIEIEMDFAQLAVKKYNIIEKRGAWFTCTKPGTGEILEDSNGNPVKLNGMSKVIDFLKLNPEYFKSIQDYILADISGEDLTNQSNEDELEDDSYGYI